MKHIFFTLFVTTLGLSNLYSQKSYSCSSKGIAYWNQIINNWERDTFFEESSLFVVNRMESMITHTTETQKSVYYVQSKIYDKENSRIDFEVTSDLGNRYTFIFHDRNVSVQIFFIKDEISILQTFLIKAVF